MPHKKSLRDELFARVARARRGAERNRAIRTFGAGGTVAILLGGMLSIGGVAEAFDGVHFLVEKDLAGVNVVRQKGDDQKVVAKLSDGFTGNSIFKLSRALPDSLVTPQISLFDDEWLPASAATPSKKSPKRDLFREEMRRINESIRREFFAASMPYGDLIYEKSKKYDVDPALVAAVIEQESRFRKRATSHVGAKGLMQLMPRTGRWMGATDLYDPEQNVDAGVKYIKYLNKRFDGNLKNTIAAYNGGEGNVMRYNGIPPFRETRTYVKKVMSNYNKRTEQLKQYDEKMRSTGGGGPLEADGSVALR